MFSSIKSSRKIFTGSIAVIGKYPSLLFPIFIEAILVFAIVVYVQYYTARLDSQSTELVFLFIFTAVFCLALIISIGNMIMLDIIQQIESGENDISLTQATSKIFSTKLLKALPITCIRAVVWFLLLILKAATSKKNNKSSSTPSSENIARSLGGANTPFSWLRLGINLFEKFIRMYFFMALPGIVWENLGPWKSLKKSFMIIKKHTTAFMTTYSLTLIATTIMVIPLAIVFEMDDAGRQFSEAFRTGVIIYECLVRMISIYLEQMNVAMLYLRHMKRVNAGSTGKLSDITRPDLLDDHYEFNPLYDSSPASDQDAAMKL